MAFIDYYKIMGIGKDTPQKDIKAAYKKRAKQFHPDLHPDDPKAKAKFQALNEAYDVLSDPEKRAKYDQYGEHWKNADMGGGTASGGESGGFEGFDFSQFGGERIEILRRNRPAVDPEAFPDVDQVGGAVEPGGEAGRPECTLQHCAGGTFAVGPRQVKEAQIATGIAGTAHQLLRRFQTGLDAEHAERIQILFCRYGAQGNLLCGRASADRATRPASKGCRESRAATWFCRSRCRPRKERISRRRNVCRPPVGCPPPMPGIPRCRAFR